MKSNPSLPWYKNLFSGFIGGIGWAAGASIGFAILVALLSFIFKLLGGIPFLGTFVGQIAQQAQEYLQTTTIN